MNPRPQVYNLAIITPVPYQICKPCEISTTYEPHITRHTSTMLTTVTSAITQRHHTAPTTKTHTPHDDNHDYDYDYDCENNYDITHTNPGTDETRREGGNGRERAVRVPLTTCISLFVFPSLLGFSPTYLSRNLRRTFLLSSFFFSLLSSLASLSLVFLSRS